MHLHRFRYIFLGIFIYIRNVVCWTCGSEFEDVASRAKMANIIFEGNMMGRYGHDEASNRQTFNAYFSVKRVLKGQLPKEPESKEFRPVIAGDFGPQDKARCIADVQVKSNATFLVFLRNNQNPTVPLYRISGFPEASNKKVLRSIRRILCDGCAKPPKVTLTGPANLEIEEADTVEVEAGKRLQLRCKTKGNPPPKITWFKDDSKIFVGDGVTIRTNKRGSRLRISKTTDVDNGVYKCIARNLEGQDIKETTVVVTGRLPADEHHEEMCTRQTFCLNGGTCFVLSALGAQFCRCTEDFMGNRCQYRNIYDVLDKVKEQDDLRFDRNMTLAGIIMSVMLLAALCIAAYCLSRQRKIDFEKRKADKERFKRQLEEANAKVLEAQKVAPPAVPAAPSDGIIRRPKEPPPSFASIMEDRKKETKSVVTQTEDLDYEIEAYLASTQSSQNNNMVATSGYSSASPDQTSLNQRCRLPGMSSSTDISQVDKLRDLDLTDHVPHHNQALVSAVIESDLLTRAPPTKRRSFSESNNAPPPPPPRNPRHNGRNRNHQYNNHTAQKPPSTHYEDNGSRRRPGVPRATRPARYEPLSGRLARDLGQDDVKGPPGSGSESDSSSSSGVEEEQALFESLKQNPRISGRNRHTSYQDMREVSHDFWDIYGTVPSWALSGCVPQYPAFNPYAIDDDAMANKYREQIYSYPTNRVRKAQSLQDRIMMELQDDADATPV